VILELRRRPTLEAVTDSDAVVGRVLAAMGGPAFAAELAAVETIEDDRVGEEVCDRVLAVAAGRADGGPGAPGAHPREVWDDFHWLVHVVARNWPRHFVDVVAADPVLRESTSVLGALGGVDGPAAAGILIEAVQIRRAGHNFARWAAVGSLVRLGHPSLPDLLVALVRDRDGLVRFSAVQAAISYGDARVLAWLRRMAEGERTPPGTREYAWDAIEAITIREGRSDVAPAPHGRRLVQVARPTGSRNGVIQAVPYRHDTVERGALLAVTRTGSRNRRALAPVDGLIVSPRPVVGQRPPEILFWLRI